MFSGAHTSSVLGVDAIIGMVCGADQFIRSVDWLTPNDVPDQPVVNVK